MNQKHVLVGLSIISIWLAVLFVGVFGEDITSESSGGDQTAVPVVAAVAFFAALATPFVAWFGFRDKD